MLRSRLRPMLWLAIPVFAEESLNILVGYTDWWLQPAASSSNTNKL